MVYLLSLPLYLVFLSHAINWKDSGELLSGGHLLSPLHFPSYPLYVHVLKLFEAIPFGSIPTRFALANGVAASLAGGILLNLSAKATSGGGSVKGWGRAACLPFVLAVLLAPTYVTEAVTIENTMLFLPLLALSLAFPIRSDSITTLFRSLAPTLLFLSYHAIFMVAGASLLLLLLTIGTSGIPRRRRIAGLAAVTLVFGSQYLFLPIRTGRPVRLTETGASSVAELREAAALNLRKPTIHKEAGRPGWLEVRAGQMLGRDGSRPSGSNTDRNERVDKAARGSVPSEAARRPSALFDEFRMRFLKKEFLLFFVPLWLLGLLWLVRKQPVHALLHAFVFLAVLGTTASQAGQETRGQSLPLLLYIAYWAAGATLRLSDPPKSRLRFILALLLLGGAVATSGRNAIALGRRVIHRGTSYDATGLAEKLLTGLSPNSVLFLSSPRLSTVGYYLQFVENRRPDVDTVIESLLVSPWYWGQKGAVLGVGQQAPIPREDRFSRPSHKGQRGRIQEMALALLPSRPIYRDAPSADIRMVASPESLPPVSALARIDWARARIDPWVAIKLLLATLEPASLTHVFSVEPGLNLPFTPCGMVYRLDGTDSDCSTLEWPALEEQRDEGTREVLALQWLLRGHYYLSEKKLDKATAAYRHAAQLDPQSPL